MDHLIKLCFLLILGVQLSGCAKFDELYGRQQGHTVVSIGTQHSRSYAMKPLNLSAILTGGMMVYAVKDDGSRQAVNLADETGQLTLNFPNGNYIFYGFGWDAANLAATSPRCGMTGVTTLAGVDTTITLNMTSGNCTSQSPFSPTFAQASGASILPLKLVPCNRYNDLTVATGAGNCQTGTESSNFIKGNTTAAVGNGDYLAGSSGIVFAAPITNTALPELYFSDLATGTQRKLNKPFPASAAGVTQVKAIPGTSRAVFLADLNTSGTQELFVHDSSTKTITKISQASPVTGFGGVKDFKIGVEVVSGVTNTYVVFVGDMDSVGVNELYSVLVSGSTSPYPTPVKISGTITTGGTGIYQCTTNCGGTSTWRFSLSTEVNTMKTTNTSNAYVVYAAQKTSTSPKELFIASYSGANLPGSTPSGTKISSSELISLTDSAEDVAFTFDGGWILYHNHGTSVDGIYEVKFNAAAAPSATAAVISTSAVYPFFVPSNTSTKIAFTAATTSLTLNLVDLTNIPGAAAMYSTLASGTPGFAGIKFTPNDANVVFATKNPSSKIVGLFSVNTTPTFVPTQLNTTPITGGTLWPRKPGGGYDYFQISSDGLNVVYMEDQTTVSSVNLYYAVIGTAGDTQISKAIGVSTTKSVMGFVIAGTTVYYTSANDTANVYQFYSTSMTAAPTIANLSGSSVAGTTMAYMDGDNAFWSTANKIMYSASSPAGGSNKEIYIYDIGSGQHIRLTKINGGSPGLGSFKVSMLPYGFTAGGPPQTFGLASISSVCLPTSAFSDGIAIPTPVVVPLGTPGTGTSPFAVQVDVYPQVTGCTGTPVSTIFPSGLTNSPLAGSAKLLGDGSSNLSLYINDK